MMPNFLSFRLTATLLFFSFLFLIQHQSLFAQEQQLGDYRVPGLTDWNYDSGKSSGDFYVFQNLSQKNEVWLKKESVACASQQEFNKFIMTEIQNLQKEQWIVEQRKPTAPYGFAGQKMGHFMKLKSKTTGQQKFSLLYFLNAKIYQIEITSETLLNTPPMEVTDFIAQISTSESKSTFVKKQTNQPASNETDPNILVSTEEPESATTDNLSGFKKVKTPPPAPQKKPAGNTTAKTGAGGAAATTGTTANNGGGAKSAANTGKTNPAATSASAASSAVPQVEKGNMPLVKFSVSDPCEGGGNADGMPWQQKAPSAKIDLPKGIEAAQVPVIPDMKSISGVSYNAAVSAAFEAMRLVYGPMPEEEAKKFEAAWTPLFDFPSQNVIDYLNKLNPLIAQFLACRESYVRTLTDIQAVLLDASIAVELKEQYAWESAMASAQMSAQILKPLDGAMKQLAQQIEALGNPPNPSDEKCAARNRYKKSLGQPMPVYPFEGEWTSEDGSKSLWKAIHSYADGTALVYCYPISWLEKMKSDGFNTAEIGMQNTENGGLGIMPGIADLTFTFEEISPGQWIAKNTFSIVFDCYAYNVNGNSMKENHYVPPGGLSKMSITSANLKKTGECPDKAPVLPSYKKSWDEFVDEFSKGADKEHERYLNWRNSSAEEIAIVIEGPSERLKRKQEYEDKKAQIGRRYRDPADGAEDLEKLNQEYADVTGAVATPAQPQQTANNAQQTNANKSKEEAARIEQEKKDAIAFHTEMVQVINKNLEREIADRDNAIKAMSQAKTPKEAEMQNDRIKEFNMRIINIQSQMQAEQDLVTSYQTGQVVHTRTVFDEYAHQKMIHDMKENAARVDATRRIAQSIDRQIELLPEELRARARETARNVVDGKALASGDVEKARKLANSIASQVQGYAEYDAAMAKVAEIDAQQNEFIAQTTIMATGAVFMGLGSAALAETFGVEAAATIYGTKALGAFWGGTTGLIAGGPKEAVTGAVSWWSPAGNAVVQFVEGYQNAGTQPNATVASQTWEAVYQAGSGYFMGKVFEAGVGVIAKGSLVAFGSESRLFKPLIKTPSQRSKEVLDAMRTTQKLANAQDEINTFQRIQGELTTLKKNPTLNSAKIQQLEKQSQGLAAGMNASYYSKWLLKYKATPETRWKFDKAVQSNYSEMTPGMVKRLEAQGYDMNGIEFKQFRNGSSGGTSSMDLDLGPVMKGTMQEPGVNKMILKKDGSVVTIEQFMKDSQKAMNDEYKQLYGLSAPSSDMNLVTSAHKEAFSTPKLLDHKIPMSSFSADEIASVGKVLTVKMDGINKNQMMTNTTKMQAQCRESSKEIENMLLRKLKEDLGKAPANSPQQKQIQADINYWEDMLKRFKTIGTDETDPMKIIQINREIMKETGGKDVTGVINDLIAAFKPKA